MKATPSRIIAVASLAHKFGWINIDDINYEHQSWLNPWGWYNPWLAYGEGVAALLLLQS